jgi:hypothetical protein
LDQSGTFQGDDRASIPLFFQKLVSFCEQGNLGGSRASEQTFT